ncbi:MAG TPA: lipoyl(octanoyl) transferase LipB [Phnomibacter sp.]|nr:lipoyl(octanoyl) transferase LipB [Phnomibacter sp.]
MSTQQIVHWKDLGLQPYQPVWDYQEQLMQQTTDTKRAEFELLPAERSTTHHLLLVEHKPVYTLGKSGHLENILISEAEMAQRGIDYFKINRGGDITFHGPQQIVGYPILDLEKFYTDIGKYLRQLEEVIIQTIGHFGIVGARSEGETGVWIEPGVPGRERKICAMGVRCSRWITMHGWALNVNTDLNYFNHIIPCGIQNKQVTSMEKELGAPLDYELVKQVLLTRFAEVFDVELAVMG